jgi:hypothetical protein
MMFVVILMIGERSRKGKGRKEENWKSCGQSLA